jgi:hypothetical protein
MSVNFSSNDVEDLSCCNLSELDCVDLDALLLLVVIVGPRQFQYRDHTAFFDRSQENMHCVADDALASPRLTRGSTDSYRSRPGQGLLN